MDELLAMSWLWMLVMDGFFVMALARTICTERRFDDQSVFRVLHSAQIIDD